MSWNRYLYGGIIFAVAGSVMYFIMQGNIGQKEVGAAFLAMVGTFLGALFAFRLNESREDTKLEKEHKAALNRALFIIARQYNAVCSLAKDLEPYKLEFERAFNCPALRPPTYSDLVHDFETLDFLLEITDPNVLMRLSVEQEGFHQMIESLRIRNDLYVNEIQPVIAQHGFNRRSVLAHDFRTALGERLYESAVNSASTLYAHVAGSRQRLSSMHAELFNAAKNAYPDAKFVKPAPQV